MTDETTTQSEALSTEVLQAEISSLKNELELLRTENVQLTEQLEVKMEQAPESLKELAARAQADLQNAKERMEREARDIRQFALEGTIRKLLPTIDNFKRAFAHLPEDLTQHDWVKGVQAVEQDLMKMLSEAGLQTMETIGKLVDPLAHEVLMAGPGQKDVIIQEFEAGYTLHGKVLRPAKVRVGDGTSGL
jgi:molecular chaperone GrpE